MPLRFGRNAGHGPHVYLLHRRRVVRARSWVAWAAAFEKTERRVAETFLLDGSRVSTVFIGLDHAFSDGPPQVFESAVFFAHESTDRGAPQMFNGRPLGESEIFGRYSTWGAAQRGHAAIVAALRAPTFAVPTNNSPAET